MTSLINSTRHWLVIILLVTGLLLPLLATLLYSLSTFWALTPLPSDWTLQWYAELARNPRFLQSLFFSLSLSMGTTLLCCLVIIPAVVAVEISLPELRKVLNLFSILPFALPPVVVAVGLLQIYSSGPLVLTGTPWILIGAWFILAYPFVYRAIYNNLAGLNLKDMLDAAQLLGASPVTSFFRIIIPNLRSGLITAILLSFSFLLGEFVFASMLAGLSYETVQVYLFNVKDFSGHFSSAIVISYITTTLFFSLSTSQIGNKKDSFKTR